MLGRLTARGAVKSLIDWARKVETGDVEAQCLWLAAVALA